MCDHMTRRTLYVRGPKAKGSPFQVWGQVCLKCDKPFKSEGGAP